MSTEKTKPSTGELFTVDGNMMFSGDGRIEFDSNDLELRLLIPNETTVGFYQNRSLPSEKHLSFTFSKDITTGTHTLAQGSPFLAANFHEALNNELGIQPPEHYTATEGTVTFVLLGNSPDNIGYLVTTFNLTVKSLRTGKNIELSGKFQSHLTYTTAN
ncbi:hypothetical protein [Pseudomonas violetae]|jgi:hypothetical protein|uniref:Uncharacterized protein n=1 Tax=Pseudomonas violetae TaxID=2915813 RepID=A0ABT0F0C0_9PSED|nr:hypothetical protein [Pseudomonas violetae]MCK1791451.1 hypothetical protein [Pseudomonas violetae]